MKYANPVAFTVHDGDEQSVVIFATSCAAARRIGANQMDVEFCDVDYCRRSPELDQFAPGPVPQIALIDSGWWCECQGCGRRVSRDEYDDDGGLIEFDLIEVGGVLFCGAACRAQYLADKAAREKVEATAIARLTATVMRLYPGAVVTRTHAYATKPRDRHFYRPQQAIVHFSFPGSKYGATLRYDKIGYQPSLSVANGDMQAWTEYRPSIRSATE